MGPSSLRGPVYILPGHNRVKTGKTPEQFKTIARGKGLLKSGVKAMEIVNWLAADFRLGRGHAMAIMRSSRKMVGSKSRMGGRTRELRIDLRFDNL